MSTWRSVLVVAVAGSLSAGPAFAEHLTVTPEARPSGEARSLDGAGLAPDVRFDVDVDAQGFRLGARVFDRHGVLGAWLNGRRSPDGLALGGEVQDGTRSYRFPLSGPALEMIAREIARRWLNLPTWGASIHSPSLSP